MLEPGADLTLSLRDPVLRELGDEVRASCRAELICRPEGGGPAVHSRPYVLTAPLSPVEQGDLDWYLERYPIWPAGVFRERARRVERQLPAWGRRIHDAVFVAETRRVLESWRRVNTSISRYFTVEVNGGTVTSAASVLLGLPWELIHDGLAYLFADVLVRRRLAGLETSDPVALDPLLRVLLVSPRAQEDRIDHRLCAGPLVEAFEPLHGLAELTILSPPTIRHLRDELREARRQRRPYQIVHFDGHGVHDSQAGGALLFEHGDPLAPGAALLRAGRFAELLSEERVALVVLQACRTARAEDDPTASVAGSLLQRGGGSVVAMTHNVLVETARRFVRAFYRRLVEGASVGAAMLTARRALREDDARIRVFKHQVRLQDWFVPVLYQAGGDPTIVPVADGARPRGPSAPEPASLGRLPEKPSHSFVGRSRELLRAERLLAREPYVVIRGEGGEGKTTLAAELVRWLVRTRRFARAAFVTLDRHPDARAALFELGEQLLPDFVSRAGRDLPQARQDLKAALTTAPTVLVFDNVETVLELEDASEQVLDLARELMEGGGARLVFTTRQPLPEPFARHHLDVGRLARDDAVLLVSRVLDRNDAVPPMDDEGESEDEIVRLVDTVRGHARSLVLLAREVAASGVRRATADLADLMAGLHERYPDDRERSLLASVELSLRRLPPETRRRLRPLAAFHGGGFLGAIARVLDLDQARDEEVALARALEEVGLGDLLSYGYLRLHPALGAALDREMNPNERRQARRAWLEAMVPFISFLYESQFDEGAFSTTLTVLDLPNLLAVLEHLSGSYSPEQAVPIVAALEALLKTLGRPRVMARASRWRRQASLELDGWSKGRFETESAAVDRFIEQGRPLDAAAAARELLARCLDAGPDAYEGAAYDAAMALFRLGRATEMCGESESALELITRAMVRFRDLADGDDENALRMARKCLTEAGDCHRAVGRLDRAAALYEKSMRLADELSDERGAAVARLQLGSVYMLQRRFPESLAALGEARAALETLGETAAVGAVWANLGRVFQLSQQFDSAEEAYRQALKLHVRSGNRPGEARALHQLGRVYGSMGRREEALGFYRRAIDLAVRMGDRGSEATARSNVADELIRLRHFGQARREILRAIECMAQLGSGAEQWKSYAVLERLELAVGEAQAAREARARAAGAFLAYRRAGGENQEPSGRLAELTREALASGEAEELAAQLSETLAGSEVTRHRRAYVTALLDILAGSRDPALATNPELRYSEAVELEILLEGLSAAEGSSGC